MASILVVDSEPLVRSITARILERAGHTVYSTQIFGEAINILRSKEPDLVLTNVYLQGITGHDAMARIKEEFPSVPVLMMTGLPDEQEIAEWTKKTGFDIFPKPFTVESLLEKVNKLLGHDGH